MGRTAAFAGAGAWNGRSGCAGVAKAGEEDGRTFEDARFRGAKKGGGGGLALFFSGLLAAFFRGVFFGLCMAIILAVDPFTSGFCGISGSGGQGVELGEPVLETGSFDFSQDRVNRLGRGNASNRVWWG